MVPDHALGAGRAVRWPNLFTLAGTGIPKFQPDHWENFGPSKPGGIRKCGPGPQFPKPKTRRPPGSALLNVWIFIGLRVWSNHPANTQTASLLQEHAGISTAQRPQSVQAPTKEPPLPGARSQNSPEWLSDWKRSGPSGGARERRHACR